MKKLLMMMAGAAIVGFSSCNSEPEAKMNYQVPTFNYITSPTAEPVIEYGQYQWDINQVDDKLSVSALNLKLGDTNANFTIPGIKYESALLEFDGHGNMYYSNKTKASGSTFSGLLVSDLDFELTPLFYMPPFELQYKNNPNLNVKLPDLKYSVPGGSMMFYTLMNYKVNGVTMVRTFWPDLVMNGETKTSVNGMEDQAFTSDKVTYRIVLDLNAKTAVLVAYNVQFNPQMPAMKVLIVPGLTMTPTAAGYTLTGNDITPLYIEGGMLMENPEFPFNTVNFRSNERLTGGELNFTVAGRFKGNFSGKGVLSKFEVEK